jgi:amino acid permease
VAVVLAATRDIGVGWAAIALMVVFVVMVGHDARSRGLSVLWGIFALSLVGLMVYVSVVRKRDGNVRF